MTENSNMYYLKEELILTNAVYHFYSIVKRVWPLCVKLGKIWGATEDLCRYILSASNQGYFSFLKCHNLRLISVEHISVSKDSQSEEKYK